MTQVTILQTLRNLIIDMDGVLYRGLEPLPGGREFLTYLRSEGVPFILATNNSTRTPSVWSWGRSANARRTFSTTASASPAGQGMRMSSLMK